MITIPKIKISEFNYDLPDEKIAYSPKEIRDESQLLVYQNKVIQDSNFKDISSFLSSQDVLIFNNSKVIHARIIVHNENGARIEIFCLEPVYPTAIISQSFEQKNEVIWKCFVGNAKKWKSPITFSVIVGNQNIKIEATKEIYDESSFLVTFRWEEDFSFSEWLDSYGKMPLPPYIKREANESDENRYQTIYAKYDGSVAAPTAGLHFTDQVFNSLRRKGIDTFWVTLHVGAGTFKPVSTTFVNDHYMHQEQIIVSREMIQKLIEYDEKRMIAVGTTVVRTLESIFIIGAKLFLELEHPFSIKQWEVYDQEFKLAEVSKMDALQSILDYLKRNELDHLVGETALMIIPGYQHKIAQGIITNFHQPQSTLLLLISSYIGDDWKRIYQHALEHNYRFLSYGDSNLYI